MTTSQVPVKLSQEEREELNQLLDGHGWPTLLKVIDALVAEQDYRVITSSLDSGAEKLVHEKARSEGARALRSKIQKVKELYKLP